MEMLRTIALFITLIRRAYMLIPCVVITGCHLTGSYGTYFQRVSNDYFPPTKKVSTRFCQFSETSSIVQDYLNKRYVVLGYSEFSGIMEPKQRAVNMAMQIGAEVVLICHPVFITTVSGSVPITTYHPAQVSEVTTEQSGIVNMWGPSGYSWGQYSAPVTTQVVTPGYSTTTNVPYVWNIFNQGAVYLHGPNSTIP